MTGKKFLRIVLVALPIMVVVMTPLNYFVSYKPTGIHPGADPELTSHLLQSGLQSTAISVLLLLGYGVSLWVNKSQQKTVS